MPVQAYSHNALSRLSPLLDVVAKKKERESEPCKNSTENSGSFPLYIGRAYSPLGIPQTGLYFSPGKKFLSPLRDSRAILARMTKTLAPSQAGVYVNLYKHICQ